jgi:hypothetical protein
VRVRVDGDAPVTNTLPAATFAAWSAAMGAGGTPIRSM